MMIDIERQMTQPFNRASLQSRVTALAGGGVFIGTSSWKYSGWCDLLYDPGRYVWRGRFAQTRFERDCLGEYAEVFQTVCVDGAYYKFPDHRYLEGLVCQVPASFLFAFKVTDEITLKRFTNLPRFGLRAGKANENFLNADLFASAFLRPCETFKEKIGLLIFEFSHFYASDFVRGRDFVGLLDQFLEKLPKGWSYGVELRNKHFLHPEYFSVLSRHGVAHIFNSWGEMPPVSEQMALPGSLTNPKLCGARFLLKPGRKYQEAVDLFSPYDRVQEPNLEARSAGAALIQQGRAARERKTFIYVNNRLEGNALMTIEAIIERASRRSLE